MNIVFFGTSSFSSRILSFLLEEYVNIVVVVTKPDKSRGRSKELLPNPVKSYVLESASHLPVYQPETVSTDDFADILCAYDPDLFVVVAYGEIIKKNVLKIPKKGSINIHPSLLPKYRGPSPIQSCIMNGDKETGVTIIELSRKMDAGDIISQAKISLPGDMNFGELEEELIEISCNMIGNVIQSYEDGIVKKISQKHEEATYTKKIEKDDCHIVWDLPAADIQNLVRAFSPTPGAWCFVVIDDVKKKLKITKTTIENLKGSPGEILSYDAKKGCIIGCKDFSIKLLEVQLEGRKIMSFEKFIIGARRPFSIP